MSSNYGVKEFLLMSHGVGFEFGPKAFEPGLQFLYALVTYGLGPVGKKESPCSPNTYLISVQTYLFLAFG